MAPRRRAGKSASTASTTPDSQDLKSKIQRRQRGKNSASAWESSTCLFAQLWALLILAVAVVAILTLDLVFWRVYVGDNPTYDAFSPTYRSAREKFQELAQDIVDDHAYPHAELHALELDIKGSQGETLATDVLVLGDLSRASRLIIHSSGVHGVEGFAGSAVQIQALRSLDTEWPAESRADVALMFVHVHTPYGMSWHRRWNENNVDLNRNYQRDHSQQKTLPLYAHLDAFINPREPVTAWTLVTSLAQAARFIAQYGYRPLKEAIAMGQTVNPHGLFYAGQKLETGPAKLLALTTGVVKRMPRLEKIVHIDVHTGLGPYGVDTLFVKKANAAEATETFAAWPGLEVEPEGAGEADAVGKVGYQLSGDSTFLSRFAVEDAGLAADKKIEFFTVCQEFGTFNSISVFLALRAENAAHQFYPELKQWHEDRVAVRHTFFPPEGQWQRAVLRRGALVLRQVLQHVRGEIAAQQ